MIIPAKFGYIFQEHKSEGFSHFNTFKALAKTMCHSLKILRSDRGREFTNEFHKFCKENGIKKGVNSASYS